jgi:hypothetical protein
LLFRGLAAAPDATDEQTVEYNERWIRWSGELASSGALVAGGPLEPRGRLVTSQGPAELELERVDIGGFLLIDAQSEEAAIDVAGRAPHIALGGSTIVRPVVAQS